MSAPPVVVEIDRRTASRAALAIAPGVLLAGVAGGIAFPILPIVGLKTGIPLPLMGVILAANRLGRVLSGPLVGTWADRLGGRRLLLGGLITQIGVMGLYLLGVTTGHPGALFLLGRLVHGPGSACVFVSAQALALEAGGKAHAGMAAGTVRAAMTMGLPLGLLVGGMLSSRWGNAGAFEASMVALVFATVAAFLWVPRQTVRVRARASISDALRAVVNLRMVLIGALNFAGAFSALGVVITTLVLVLDSQKIEMSGLDPTQTASLLMGWMVVAIGLITLAASRLVRPGRPQAWVALVGIGSLGPAMFVVGRAQDFGGFLVGLTLLAVGAGCLGASLLALVPEFIGPEQRGAGVGWLQLCGDAGGMLGPVIGTTLLRYGAALTYDVTGAVMLCFVPVAGWLIHAMSSSSASPIATGSPS